MTPGIWNIQLVFDCADPDVVMLFWGPKLQYRSEQTSMTPDELREWRKGFPQFDGRGRVDDVDGRRMPIYIQQVPEAKQGPNRLRLELSSPDEPAGEYADPEGNEYTVEGGDVTRLKSVVFDCVDKDRMLEFWSKATGYVASDRRLTPTPGAFRIENGKFLAYGREVPGERATWTLGFSEPATMPDREVHDLIPGIAFRETGEPKRFKNRLHLDLRPFDREEHRAKLERLGATVLEWGGDFVMRDPEGNEFCCG